MTHSQFLLKHGWTREEAVVLGDRPKKYDQRLDLWKDPHPDAAVSIVHQYKALAVQRARNSAALKLASGHVNA